MMMLIFLHEKVKVHECINLHYIWKNVIHDYNEKASLSHHVKSTLLAYDEVFVCNVPALVWAPEYNPYYLVGKAR